MNDKKTTGSQQEPNKPEGLRVSAKEIINSFESLRELSSIPFPFKISHAVSQVLKKATSVVDDYNEGLNKIMASNGGVPSPNGLKIDENTPNREEAFKNVTKYIEDGLKAEIKLLGTTVLDLKEIQEAMPSTGSEKDNEGKTVEKEPRITAQILADLDWLIIPPTDW